MTDTRPEEPLFAMRSMLPARGGLWITCDKEDADEAELEGVEVRLFSGHEELFKAQQEVA